MNITLRSDADILSSIAPLLVKLAPAKPDF